MLRDIKLKVLRISNEWHWWVIERKKRNGNKLIENGELLTSDKLIKLSRNIEMHEIKIYKNRLKYKKYI
ncbi:hypothetical protein [Anaerovorax odorimutans]|uniref:hypothetical protein n=1 Tax=Anaerovorax odorimutans TaxID=109327 RepID=UPI000412C051|nr:hypothetical protein [Anaerovorax odorimutans]